MYNQVVRIIDKLPCYEAKYWFVYQYVPDMEFCHLCPMETHGLFDHNTTRRAARLRLVPEGQCREVDVGAARVRLVAKTVGQDSRRRTRRSGTSWSPTMKISGVFREGAVFIAEESDGEEKVAPSVALGTKFAAVDASFDVSRPAGCGRRSTIRRRRRSTARTCGPPRRSPLPAPAEAPPPAPGGDSVRRSPLALFFASMAWTQSLDSWDLGSS